MTINNLFSKIEPHFHSNISGHEVTEVFSPKDLNICNRFDIGFKLAFLEGLIEQEKSIFEKLYLRHIEAFTAGSFKEPGNEYKKSPGDFVSSFLLIYQSIKKQGFDSRKSLLPLNCSNSLLNGAHRASILLFLNINGYSCKFKYDTPAYDHKFFFKAGMHQKELDTSAKYLIKYFENARVFIVWPKASEKLSIIERKIKDVFYKKTIKLSYNGLKQLVKDVYQNEDWAGNSRGLSEKTHACASENATQIITIFCVLGSKDGDFLETKNEIRHLCNVGKHSVHSSDNHPESIRLAQVILNDNYLQIINQLSSKYNKNIKTGINILKKWLEISNVNDDYVVTGGFILAVLGLRSYEDIDLICLGKYSVDKFPVLSSHESQLKYYKNPKQQLIKNDDFYFYLEGIKILCLDELIEMKSCRLEQKDIADIKLLNRHVKPSKRRQIRIHILSTIMRIKWKVRAKLIALLKLLNLFGVVRSFYRFLLKLFN